MISQLVNKITKITMTGREMDKMSGELEKMSIEIAELLQLHKEQCKKMHEQSEEIRKLLGQSEE